LKNILIIGWTGFLGNALYKELNKDKINYKLFYFDSKKYRIEEKKSLYNYDLCEIHHVFHLAGKSSVVDSWNSTFEYFQSNVIGTLNVLEFCKRNNCSLTFLSSYLYGKPKSLPIYESDTLNSLNPYAQTKYLSELNSDFYSKNFNLNIVVLRLFNAYGPGQNNSFLIPTILEQFLNDKQSSIFINDTTPKRDFVFVDDIVSALISSINQKSEVYNISSGISYSVLELIKTISDITGIRKSIVERSNIRKNEINDLYGNYDKIRKDYNWQPTINIREGLIKCIEYYKNNS
jgi:nucleoside-diphosphate-sugar epimerase